MRKFRNIPLKSKLTSIIMLMSNSILLIGFLSFITYDIMSLHSKMIENVSTIGKVIGKNITAAMYFDDRKAAEKILKALSTESRVISAYVYKEDGTEFVSYANSRADRFSDQGQPDNEEKLSVNSVKALTSHLKDNEALPHHKMEEHSILAENMDINEIIMLDGDVIGLISIKYDMGDIRSHIKWYGGVGTVVFLILLLIGYGISLKLQKVISDPILKLNGAMKSISDEKKYSVRVEKDNNDEIGNLVDGFNNMLAQVESRDVMLMEAHGKLEDRVEERTRELQQEIIERKNAEEALQGSQKQLLDAAHKAGMADIATGILHNLGNVMNSVNASVEEIMQIVRASKVTSLKNANQLLHEHIDHVSEFLSTDEKGRKLPMFYLKLGDVLLEENSRIEKSTKRIEEKIRTMKGIVETQQEFARAEFHSEQEELPKIINDVLKIQKDQIESNGVHVTGDYEKPLRSRVHKYKLIQVLLNLVKNAVESMKGNDFLNRTRELMIETGHIDENHEFIRVIDNGCGIPQKNLIKIFNHGFTTKEKGHGFGLHASANAMTEMGGSITVESDGENTGATFMVKLPVDQESMNEGGVFEVH